MLTRPLLWMSIAWPAFLAACGLEFLVFGLVDPGDLHWFDALNGMSNQGVYTLAFFVFWAICAAATGLAVILARPLDISADSGEA
jgi:hypothetical protein